MPKVKISLKPIEQQVKAIQGELKNAAAKAATRQGKLKAQRAARQLNAVIKEVKLLCRGSGYGIEVPTE